MIKYFQSIFLDHDTVLEYNDVVDDKHKIPRDLAPLSGRWFNIKLTAEESTVIVLKFDPDLLRITRPTVLGYLE